MSFGPLHHVGIVVESFTPARENICKLLGGTVVDEGGDEELQSDWLWIESPGNPVIELLTATGPGPIADYLDRRGPGIHHLSHRPESLDGSLRHVRGCGLPAIGENRDHAGYEEFFVHPSATGGALFHSFRELSG